MVPYLLTGEPFPPHLLAQHVFTSIVPTSQVLSTAVDWASRIVSCSPDAVWVTKDQINLWKDGNGIQQIVQESARTEQALALYDGENLKEGLKAFVEVGLRF